MTKQRYTLRATIQIIQWLGIRATWRAEWNEFRVFYPEDALDRDKGAFTDDREDAIGTAAHMARHKAILLTIKKMNEGK